MKSSGNLSGWAITRTNAMPASGALAVRVVMHDCATRPTCAACDAALADMTAEVQRLRALIVSYERAVKVWVRAAVNE
jgi:hypothetical protein